jgi:hypothetical protein
MNMTKQILIGVVYGMLLSCNNQPPKASPDVVNNPVSASNTEETKSKTIEEETNRAILSFEKTDHDFGNITEGEKAVYAFKFKNTGKQQLLISGAAASCGCTVPSYSKEPIAPGAEGFIKVEFDSKYRQDWFEKSVIVTANTKPTETTLYIRGFVVPRPNQEKLNMFSPPAQTPQKEESHEGHNH